MTTPEKTISQPEHPALRGVLQLASSPSALTIEGWTSVPGINPRVGEIVGGYIQLVSLAKQAENAGGGQVHLLPAQIQDDVARAFGGMNGFAAGPNMGGDARYAAEAILGGLILWYAYERNIPLVVGDTVTFGKEKKVVSLKELLAIGMEEETGVYRRRYGDSRYAEDIPRFLQARQADLAQLLWYELEKNPEDRVDAFRDGAIKFLNYLLFVADNAAQQMASGPLEVNGMRMLSRPQE